MSQEFLVAIDPREMQWGVPRVQAGAILQVRSPGTAVVSFHLGFQGGEGGTRHSRETVLRGHQGQGVIRGELRE